MSRPRIRTLKPEVWADEKIGQVSRDARLLFVGLITFADDDGRFRALHQAIVGHAFPYDQDAPRKLKGWLGELEQVSLIDLYEHAGTAYGLIPKFRDHQRISHPKESILPPPPSTHNNGRPVEKVRN
jgi:hypothetical protein